MRSKYLSLAIFAGLVVLASQAGATFMPGTWYAGLAKPSWTPPSAIFPIAWTILYVMIALAGWYAWRTQGFGAAVIVWGVQLVVNAVWSYLMFGRHDIALAFGDIVLLLAAIVAFIALTWRRSRAAALLFVPYLLWVVFAAALNFEIWRLNG